MHGKVQHLKHAYKEKFPRTCSPRFYADDCHIASWRKRAVHKMQGDANAVDCNENVYVNNFLG